MLNTFKLLDEKFHFIDRKKIHAMIAKKLGTYQEHKQKVWMFFVCPKQS